MNRLTVFCNIILFALFTISSASCAELYTQKPEPKNPPVDTGRKILEGGYIYDPKSIPIDPKTTKALAERGYSTLLLPSAEGVAAFTIKGEPIKPDIELKKGQVLNDKLKNKNIESFYDISVMTISGSPRCNLQRIGPYGFLVHAGGDGYPTGARPCHAGNH